MNDKYAVFKRADAIGVTDGYITFKEDVEIPDAVVIRRQDKFAAPCLYTYANMIGLVAMEHPDTEKRDALLEIADYFQGQAEMAGDEGYKLPDL